VKKGESKLGGQQRQLQQHNRTGLDLGLLEKKQT
jgi:hypothetical protein